MSGAINDGGPAFPVADIYYPDGRVQFGPSGMTLRDYFAGKVICGMLSDPNCNESTSILAKAAYSVSDAMILARNGGAK